VVNNCLEKTTTEAQRHKEESTEGLFDPERWILAEEMSIKGN
jgi:hypothetical protein